MPAARSELAPHATSVARRPGFRTGIRGLRAISVGAVLLYHAGIPFVSGGFIGVDVFFVISGFLITRLLPNSLEIRADTSDSRAPGGARTLPPARLDFTGFYAHRARRILSAATTVTVLTVIAALIVVPPPRLESILRDALSAALYVPNLYFAAERTDYLGGSEPSPF